MDAILAIDKPAGMTSFDAVSKVRRAARERRAGHTGTLDPEATGVLVICIGRATRLSSRLAAGKKVYEAELCFGRSTDTADAWGNTILEKRDFSLDPENLSACLKRFKGDILQVPPMFSALKVGGRKLYELARRGEQVEREARPVTVYSIYAEEGLRAGAIGYGDAVRISIECSPGTYIRTLCEDIGKRLGIPSHMSGLRRTYTSGFSIEQCLGMDHVVALSAEGKLDRVVTRIEDCLPSMPRVMLSQSEAERARNGNELLLKGEAVQGEAMLLGPGGEAVAIAAAECISGFEGGVLLRPRLVFNGPEVNSRDGS